MCKYSLIPIPDWLICPRKRYYYSVNLVLHWVMTWSSSNYFIHFISYSKNKNISSTYLYDCIFQCRCKPFRSISNSNYYTEWKLNDFSPHSSIFTVISILFPCRLYSYKSRKSDMGSATMIQIQFELGISTPTLVNISGHIGM